MVQTCTRNVYGAITFANSKKVHNKILISNLTIITGFLVAIFAVSSGKENKKGNY